MNKRIRRRVHTRYLNDVIYAISIASPWRKKLFEAEYGIKFEINRNTTTKEEVHEYFYRLLCRYSLKYCVSKVQLEEVSGWEGYDGCEIFKFESVEFPEIFDFSANNPQSV